MRFLCVSLWLKKVREHYFKQFGHLEGFGRAGLRKKNLHSFCPEVSQPFIWEHLWFLCTVEQGLASGWGKGWFPLGIRNRFVSVSRDVLSSDWAVYHKLTGLWTGVWDNVLEEPVPLAVRVPPQYPSAVMEGTVHVLPPQSAQHWPCRACKLGGPFLVHPSYLNGGQRQALLCSQCPANVAAVVSKSRRKKSNFSTKV